MDTSNSRTSLQTLQQQNAENNLIAQVCQVLVFVDFGKLTEEFLCEFHHPIVWILCFQPMSVHSYFCSIYSSDEDDEDIEMCDHDYDGLLPKSGKRHLGKTRWTREEVTSYFY